MTNAADTYPTFYVDMHGVLTDFVGAACAVHGRPIPYLDFRTPTGLHAPAAGQEYLQHLLGMSTEAFWAPMNDYRFWRGLPPMPDATALFDAAAGSVPQNRLFVVAGTSLSSVSAAAAIDWIEAVFPRHARRVIPCATPDEAISGHGRILITARDSLASNWERFGGVAVLVPRPWNSLHSQWRVAVPYTVDRVAYVMRNCLPFI